MKISEYPSGMPCWIDLATPDVGAARDFYTQLFGWTARSTPERDAGYAVLHRGDDPVAGIGPLADDEQPTTWSWYAATEDLDAATERVEDAGGRVLAAPVEVGTSGRMGTFADAHGTPFSVWEPRGFGGSRVVGEPGSLGWTELLTHEPDEAVGFYGRALGWARKPGGEPGSSYTEFQIGGRSIAGMMPMTDGRYPDELPDHWMVYFCVADTDAASRRVLELGGGVSVPPRNTPAGRFSVAIDPAGAWFSLISALPPDAAEDH